jgi:hypothetical protein
MTFESNNDIFMDGNWDGSPDLGNNFSYMWDKIRIREKQEKIRTIQLALLSYENEKLKEEKSLLQKRSGSDGVCF